jgi:hypothetical protein
MGNKIVQTEDSYQAGRSIVQATVNAKRIVADQIEQGEAAQSNRFALQRWLSKAVWSPASLLPSQGIVWEAMDDNTARVTATDGTVSASLEFEFGKRGEIIGFYTPDGSREVNGIAVPTPWGGRYHNYLRIQGMQIPLIGEMAWILPEGRLPYCHISIQDAEYEENYIRALG